MVFCDFKSTNLSVLIRIGNCSSSFAKVFEEPKMHTDIFADLNTLLFSLSLSGKASK